ncbi:MAG: hypothetical protein K5930_06265 [Treponemataceae bacterium]|nr:hypothetical protein [Treponemataceae bacterium]
MGLYKLITENYLRFQKDAAVFQGLLNHAEHILNSVSFNSLTDEAFIFFNSFVEELGISKMAVLLPDNNQFKMYLSYGFKSGTEEQMVSTKDFWEGTLPGDRWLSVTKEDIVPFRQIFSDEDNAEISILHVKRMELKKVPIIILITEGTKISLVDTELVDIVLPSLYPYIEKCLNLKRLTDNITFPSEFDTAVNIENSLIENSKGFLFEISLDSFFASFPNLTGEARQILFKVLFNALSLLIKVPDILYVYQDKIKIIRFSNNELDEDLFSYQLKKTISPVFSEEKADLIDIKSSASSSDINELTDFLHR